jgi:BMFP domain-containing protein YqiC
MAAATILAELQEKLSALLANTPAADIERNAKALLAQGFAKLDLATREEFEVQVQVLTRTREKLEALEKRVAELERQLAARP